MQTSFIFLFLALTTGTALAAPAAIPRIYEQEQPGDLNLSQAPLAASMAALQSSQQTAGPVPGNMYALAKRAQEATLEGVLIPVDMVPFGGVTASEHVSSRYAKRDGRSRRRSVDSDAGREDARVRNLDESATEDDAMLLGREPRGMGKRLGVALGGGAFGAMMAQLGQALILGVDPIPLKSKRSLHSVQDWDENGERTIQEKRTVPAQSFFDALARKLFEKFFTSGGSGVIYQPLRYKFRQIFGKAQHGHT